MKIKRIILMLLAASFMGGARIPAAIDDPEQTSEFKQNSPPLGPKVTPSAGATEIRDPAPTRTPAAKEVRTTTTKESSSSEIGKYRTIIERSPFRNSMVPQGTGGGDVTANSPLHLNGIIRIGDQLSAGIEDTVQRRSLIVAVGHTEEGIEIQSIDEANQTVSLLYNGQFMKLEMEKSPGMSGAPMPGAPGQNPAVAGGNPATIQPQPANVQPPGGRQQPIVKRKRIIIPREK